MVVRIRLARMGPRRLPYYNIVIAQARTARDSKPMEVLGTWSPLPQTPLASADTPEFQTDSRTGKILRDAKGQAIKYQPKKFKDLQLDTSRTKYWLGVGAQPSDAVEKLLSLVGCV